MKRLLFLLLLLPVLSYGQTPATINELLVRIQSQIRSVPPNNLKIASVMDSTVKSFFPLKFDRFINVIDADGYGLEITSGTGIVFGSMVLSATESSFLVNYDNGGSSQNKISVSPDSISFRTNNTNRFAVENTGAWSVGGNPGTATQVLTSNGSASPPTWEDASGSGFVWGEGTGTLSDQTDLQAALDAKEDSGLSWLLASGGTLTANNTITGGTFRTTFTGSGDDQIVVSGSGTGRSGIQVQATSANGNATFYFQNNRGSFASYGGVLTGGSTNSNTLFGLTRADKTFLIHDGASGLGLGIGTLNNTSITFGTNNTSRMVLSNAGVLTLNGSLVLGTVGNRISIKTGTNASAGTAVLVAGTVTVNTTAVTANSIIMLTSQSDGGTPGFVRITAKTAGTSFVITSSSGSDTSTIGWFIIEGN